MKFEDSPFHRSPIPPQTEGGCLVTFPDLPRFLADAAPFEESTGQAREAFQAWAMAETKVKEGSHPASVISHGILLIYGV